MRLLFLLALFVSAPAFAAETLTFSRASVIASEQKMPIAGISMVIVNDGADDKITAARSTAGVTTGLRTTIVAENGAIMSDKTPSIAIPGSGKTTVLNAAGEYITLQGLTRPLKEGEKFPLLLTFEKGGEKTVEVEVVSADAFIKRFPPEIMGQNLEKSRMIYFKDQDTKKTGSIIERLREKIRGPEKTGEAAPAAESTYTIDPAYANQVAPTPGDKAIILKGSGKDIVLEGLAPAPAIPVIDAKTPAVLPEKAPAADAAENPESAAPAQK